MAYYIFLKSLRSLEEFRENPHVKIPPKSPSTNFQILGKFKNPIFNSEILFLDFGPVDLAAHPASQPSQPIGRAAPTGRNYPNRPPLPRLSVNRAIDVSSIPHLQPPELARAATDSRPPSSTQLRASGAIEPLPPRLHFPSLNFPP
jgi:hypothetical protein